jgi:phosphatidylglycerol:prolipoprotein diacylglycerol transferase
MEYWNHIYEHFNPVAFTLLVPVHWYGLMYVMALLTSLYMAKKIVEKDQLGITKEDLDDFFIYVEVGVILGARLGYILFYDPNTLYYITHPWQIFNPFQNGEFIGIRGMSYHGALLGFLLGAYIFSKRTGNSFGKYMDLVAVAVPLGYVFGRIGNFLNQELVGRATDVPWGIYVGGVLRHPSQLYEAFLEGIVLFVIVYMYRKHKRFDGELLLLYGFAYGILRATAEIFRAPDTQIGYICCDAITLGQTLSLSMTALAVVIWLYISKVRSRKPKPKR